MALLQDIFVRLFKLWGYDLPNVDTYFIHSICKNSFQACTQKDLPGFQNLAGLGPLFTVSTSPLQGGHGGWIQISISDNGPGIPSSIKDKIFQPFFTTKPTGQGTGLGLSLSYDIVKAPGGEIRVESVEGEGSTFFISFPINMQANEK